MQVLVLGPDVHDLPQGASPSFAAIAGPPLLPLGLGLSLAAAAAGLFRVVLLGEVHPAQQQEVRELELLPPLLRGLVLRRPLDLVEDALAKRRAELERAVHNPLANDEAAAPLPAKAALPQQPPGLVVRRPGVQERGHLGQELCIAMLRQVDDRDHGDGVELVLEPHDSSHGALCYDVVHQSAAVVGLSVQVVPQQTLHPQKIALARIKKLEQGLHLLLVFQIFLLLQGLQHSQVSQSLNHVFVSSWGFGGFFHPTGSYLLAVLSKWIVFIVLEIVRIEAKVFLLLCLLCLLGLLSLPRLFIFHPYQVSSRLLPSSPNALARSLVRALSLSVRVCDTDHPLLDPALASRPYALIRPPRGLPCPAAASIAKLSSSEIAEWILESIISKNQGPAQLSKGEAVGVMVGMVMVVSTAGGGFFGGPRGRAVTVATASSSRVPQGRQPHPLRRGTKVKTFSSSSSSSTESNKVSKRIFFAPSGS